MDGDGQRIDGKKPLEGKAVLPHARHIIIERRKDEKVRRQRGVAERPLQQDGAEHKGHSAQQRGKVRAREKAHQQRDKPALQNKAQRCVKPEVLERLRQQRAQQPEKGCEKRDGIGEGDAGAVGPVQVVCLAQRQREGRLAVEQPAGVMLLHVLLDVAAAQKRVVGHVQRRNAV